MKQLTKQFLKQLKQLAKQLVKPLLLCFALLLAGHSLALGQASEQAQIRSTLQTFIDGTVYNYPDSIAGTFYPGTRMFLYSDTRPLWAMTSEEYAALYTRRPRGSKNNRSGTILSIEVVQDVAYAKVQVDVPVFGNRYYDLLLLKKIEGTWKIVGKCTAAEPIPKRPQDMVAKPVKEVVMEGLKRPWSMAFLSEEEALVAEKDGNLLKVNLATQKREVIQGLPADVARAVTIDTSKVAPGVFPAPAHGKTLAFNAGWFQVLLDPDFENNNYIYLSYAAENKARASALKVIRGRLEGCQLTDVETLFFAGPHSHGLFHYGGGMLFGPDGKLYITTGERNFYEHNNPALPLSQDVSDPRGKVIRLNPDGSIPEDNPDFGAGAVPGLYATGVRAAQGLALDPGTGKLWFSEHGTHQGDELNILTPGANYGWPYQTSGRYRTQGYAPEVPEGLSFTAPNYYWDQTVAPTGLVFYRGRTFPQWQGSLLVPGLSKGSLWRMVIENDKVVQAEQLFVDDRVRLRKASLSPRGVLYLLTDEENGKLIRITNANGY